MSGSPAHVTDRLALLEDRLAHRVAAEPRTGPFRDVDNALDALSEAIEALSFGGTDQRIRARDMLRATRRQLHSLQLTKDDE